MRTITIGDHPIGPDHPPIVISETSGNHSQSLDRALAIMDAIATTGADTVKLQTYTAATMTLDIRERELVIDDPNRLWHGSSLYGLYEEAHPPGAGTPPSSDAPGSTGSRASASPRRHRRRLPQHPLLPHLHDRQLQEVWLRGRGNLALPGCPRLNPPRC
jgi:hypothetical protein